MGLILLYLVIATIIFVLVPISFYQLKSDGINSQLTSALQETGTGRLENFLVLFIVGLIYLGCGIWVFIRKRFNPIGQSFTVFVSSIAIACSTPLVSFTTNPLNPFFALSLALAGSSLISLALLFPNEVYWTHRYPFLRWISYLIALILFSLTVPSILNLNFSFRLDWIWGMQLGYLGLAILIYLFMNIYCLVKNPYPVERKQSYRVLWAAILSFLLPSFHLILILTDPSRDYQIYALIPTLIFPLVLAYLITRNHHFSTHDSWQLEPIYRQSLLYTFMAVSVILAYALMVSGLGIIIEGSGLLDINQPGIKLLLQGFVFFLLALGINPARHRFESAIDYAFARRSPRSQKHMTKGYTELTRDITQTIDLRSLLILLTHFIQDRLQPLLLHIFILDKISDQYIATPEIDQTNSRPTSDLRFSASSKVVQTLSKQPSAILLEGSSTMVSELQTDQARLTLLGAKVLIPIPGQNKLVGWVALGQRQSGERYTRRDLEFLEGLCERFSLALERAQVVADLERRVHAMNVLIRISQGLNVTVAFDDILELIYAQTNQVIPTRDFLISLYDPHNDEIYPVFYLENDERIKEKENIPIPIGQGLEQEVLKSRRSNLTDDYGRECRNRGVLPLINNIYAWISVPLNTGAETIGVISTGSRDSSISYTSEQLNLLQAIADQAAGAIVKARLLNEADRRTKQLTTLNDVTRSLTSTLALEPLLNQILSDAVEILNCEAGSLLLVDEDTGDLIFEVALGPVGESLLGTRIPPGTGLVGKAVDSRQAIIANDVRRSKEWFAIPDAQTGFTTNDLLVVPMQFKEKVIGVIEVINRKDKLPFNLDDQELLIAFASQAAIAFENARLYTLTDQTLAERVEELSVMQRIDRELNTSLDIHRAIHITLDWAMRQSRSDAGLVGFTEEGQVRVMASQGYTTELPAGQDYLISLALPAWTSSTESGTLQPQIRTRAQANNPSQFVHNDAQTQIVIPIRRESTVIGVILLENCSPEHPPQEKLAFLSRLSDHAAIAIANAQLYSEIRAANLAKSDFISFVSHELKTPMTSIKGFTDLLASGVVGSVNEAQSNFLDTIRSNVDRMATLVSDLADVSRIEAGRLRLEFSAVSLQDALDEVIRSIHNQIETKGQILTVCVPQMLPDLWCDRTRLIQIITNLISNAHKYTPQSGNITITAEATANLWDSDGASRVVHLVVQDTGIGIGHEDQKKIFQKFFRADDQKVRDAAGTGLGLNITKTLVEMQGGGIWFESELRKGTAFHIILPVTEGG
jgi:signal transduction histidine kinase